MTNETKPRRGRRFLKILLLLLLLMIVILALLPTIASTATGRAWVTERLAGALDRDVTLGDFDAGWGSGLTFTELRVANPEGFSPEALFSARSLLFRPGIVSALGGDMDVVIELRDARLRVERGADGVLNLDGMLASGEEAPRKGPGEGASMALRVVIEDFTLTFLDHGKPEGERETVIEGLDLTLTLAGDAPATIAGALEATIRRVATASGLESGIIRIRGRAEKGVFHLEEVNVPLGDGQVVATGQLDFRKARAFEADIEARDVLLARGFPFLDHVLPIFDLDGGGSAQGTLSATVSLSGAGFDLASLEAHLTGEGDLAVTKGRIRGNSIVARALKLAGKKGALSYDKLETGFTIENGRVHTQEVDLGEGALQMRLMGSVGFDGSVDYVLGMKPRGQAWRLIRKEFGEDGLIPIRITGSLGDLHVEKPDPKDLLKRLLDRKTGGLLDDLRGR